VRHFEFSVLAAYNLPSAPSEILKVSLLHGQPHSQGADMGQLDEMIAAQQGR
jgi:hypothetical protein